jgi:hypothetical protein
MSEGIARLEGTRVPLLETLKGFRDHVPAVVSSLYGPGASR